MHVYIKIEKKNNQKREMRLARKVMKCEHCQIMLCCNTLKQTYHREIFWKINILVFSGEINTKVRECHLEKC